MSATKLRRAKSRGSILVVVSFATVAIAALSFAMLQGSATLYHGARARVESAKSFYVAEGGLDWTMSQIANDPYVAVRDTTHFPTANADGSYATDWIPLGQNAGDFQATVTYATLNKVPTSWTGTGLPPGFQQFVTMVPTDRTQSPDYDRVLVSVKARYNGTERACRAVLKQEFRAYGAALVCDAEPNDPSGTESGLTLAQDTQGVVLSGARQYVHGGLASNGPLYKTDSNTEVTDANVATALPNFHGAVVTGLLGTARELPDYTAPGMGQQLFDFGVYRSAAQAGKGSYHASLAAFATAMNAANLLGKPLEGIVFVNVDANAVGSRALMTSGSATSGAVSIPGGINVKGCLCLHVVNAPTDHYRVSIETALNVNPATLGTSYDPSNASSFTSGYPAAVTASMDPTTYAGFKTGDDLPAVMIDNGSLEIMRAANVCGAVYAPTLLRVENTQNEKQLFDGSLIAGAGVYADGGTATTGSQVFAFDPRSVDDLRTFDGLGKAPVLAGYVIDK